MKRLLLCAAMLVLAVSCVRPWGPGGMKRELSRDAGVQLDREFGLTVTRSGIWLARKVMQFSDDDDIPDLRGLRRVQIGVYRVVAERDEMRALSMNTFGPDWAPLVRVVDGDETVQMLARERGGELRAMLVVVAERDEWVIVKLSGRLDRIVESAMQFAFEQAERPELSDAAVAAYRSERPDDIALSGR